LIHPITIRPATDADAPALRDLAGLADRPLPAAPLLVAETNGSLVAVRSLSQQGSISDPFRLTADVISLLDLRAAQLREVDAA
jgi:hypothetical protein